MPARAVLAATLLTPLALPAGAVAQDVPCKADGPLAAVTVRAADGGGVRISGVRASTTFDVLRASTEDRVIPGTQRVRRFSGRTSAFSWSGAGASEGLYVVRATAPDGTTRRFPLRRAADRFVTRPPFTLEDGCGPVPRASLSGPAFGGSTGRALDIRFALNETKRITLDVLQGERRVARLASRTLGKGNFRYALPARRAKAGDHRVVLRVGEPGAQTVITLVSRRL